MKLTTFFLFFVIQLCSFSQSKFYSESYRVVLADIETNTFEKDSTANAFVIYEQGNSYVDPGDYKLRTEKKHKIKILNQEGFNQSNITIPLYKKNSNSYESIDKIIATTYNKTNGKVIKTKLDTKDIFREEHSENITLVKFTLPNVKLGSVITYSYTIKSPFMFKYRGWEFQGDIPKLYSEYKTSIPGNWLYHIKLVGYKKLDVETSDIKRTCLEYSRGGAADCAISTYGMKDIPAFIEEDHMTTKSNYLARIEYELKTFKGFDGTFQNYTKTWKDVDKELRLEPSIGKQLFKKVKPEDLLSSDILSETASLKKAEAIFNYVQDNFTWNKKFSIFKKSSIKELLDKKSGNVSSINILLCNLLNSCDIPANVVLISTRQNGFPTKIYPVISDFNYVIVQAKIDDKTYLLDATDPYLSFGQIPFRCLNQYGRLLDFKNGSSWIDITSKKPTISYIKANLNINSDGEAKGTYTSNTTGYHGLNLKKKYFSNTTAYFESLQNKHSNINIENPETKTDKQTEKSFHYAFDFTLEDFKDADNLYINPFIFPFFKENPFRLQERTYPVDFGYKDSYVYTFTLNLDKAYKVVSLPKKKLFTLPNNAGLINFSSNVFNDAVNITYRVDFKEALYPADYYPYLKEFMNRAVNIETNSLIVLKKN